MRAFDMSLFTEIYQDVEPVAIIGAGCRFMGAADPFTFWRRLADGEELSRRVTAQDLAAAGLDPALLERDDFVPVASVVDEAEHFDAGLFGYSPAEAATIDPQQRLFLACSREALDMAGLAGSVAGMRIGVFGSARMSTFVMPQPEDVLSAGQSRTFQRLIGNDKDYLATRTAYKLGLTGPALTVQTACSSSLVAVHVACEQLRSGECDLALAGGAALTFPMAAGYFHQPGMIFSPDGTCRPFDAEASGTFIGNGVGVVLLKPLRRALEDGDGILAVIRGSAVNNDGTDKAGFTAPSLAGQRAVIEEAMALAGVTSDRIGMVETHGTATPLGDPIELNALAEAFGRDTPRRHPCALGALKANTGHLDTAAGIGALIKAAFSVRTGLIAPCLHFRKPNPALEIDATPFIVPQALQAWPEGPRIAGVSSFGIGGTNCHVIVEDLPEPLKPAPRTGEGPLRLALAAPDLPALRALSQAHADLLLDGAYQGELPRYCDTLVRQHRGADGMRLEIGGGDGLDLARTLSLFARTGGEDEAFVQDKDEAAPFWRAGVAETELPAGPAGPRVVAPVAPRIGSRIARPGAQGQRGDGWRELVASLGEASRLRAAEHDWSSLDAEGAAVARLHAIHVAHAFDRLGVFAGGAWRTVEEAMAAGGILPHYAQLTARLLRDLVDEGVLQREGDRFGALIVPPMGEAEPLLADMAGRGYRRLTGMVARVGPQLAQMLTGAVDAVSLVFPSAAMDDVEDMYERQRDSVFLNDLAADAVAALIEELPADKPLRVLEVGAGTGGTTSALLPVLPTRRTRYTFTDIGPLFLRKARDKFAAFPFLDFATLDIEKDLVAQGFEPGGYDLVVAANVLHNGRDLTRVLADVRRLLAPGGVLLMREISEPKPLFDFIFGPLVPVLDDIEARGGELFPSLARWGTFLTEAGWSDWSSFPPPEQKDGAIGESILLARNGTPPAHSASALAGRQLETAPVTDAAGLLAGLAGRAGDGFWRFEGVQLAPAATPQPAHWITAADELALATDEGERLIAARPVPFAGAALPPLPQEGAAAVSGPLADLLRPVLAELPGKGPLVADAVSGTCGHLSDARLAVRTRQDGGLDLAVFDQADWPALWIDNLRKGRPATAATRPQLCHWRWEAANFRASGGRVAAVISRASGFFVPPGLSAGDTCLVDLADVDDGLSHAILHAGLAELVREASQAGCRLVLLTRGALAVVPWDRPKAPFLAGIAGLVRVAAQEYPGLALRLVDDDGSHGEDALHRACLVEDGEAVVALRRGRRFVPRLVAEDNAAVPLGMERDGVHLLLGGLAPMALATAEWLAGKGARSLRLVARRAPSDVEAARLAALTAAGVEVTVDSEVDLTDENDLDRLFAGIEGRSLASVFHFAGHLEDMPLAALDAAALERVLAPKLRPAEALRRHLARLAPARVVFASSAATVFGPAGQAAHAIANAALEGLAAALRADGVPATALAWGYWQDGRAERVRLAQDLAGRGMLTLAPADALALMETALQRGHAVASPLHVDWQALTKAAGGRLPPALSRMAPAAPAREPALAHGDTVEPLGVETWLVDRLASLLALPRERIDMQASLLSLGVDSLMMLELAQAVKGELGLELSGGFALQDHTPASLAKHLREAGGQMPAAAGADLEGTVRTLVADLLSLPSDAVRPESRLIDLGLDSLLFLDLAERLAAETGLRLSGEAAMRFDTVAALVEGIRAQGGTQGDAEAGSLRAALDELAASRPGLLLANGDLAPVLARPGMTWPLSPLQRAWWLGRRAGAPLGGTARHMYVEYDKETASFDLDAFEQAWARFVQRHPALRMTVDAEGRAVPADVETVPAIVREDLSGLPDAEREERLDETRRRMSAQAFDLSAWPFFEWRASLLPEGRIRLHFDIDTTFLDIESFQVMLRELGRHVADPERELPRLGFSATDYMRGMALLGETKAAAVARKAAGERLAALPPAPDLPLAALPETLPPRFAIERRALDRASWLSVRDAAASRGVSGTALVLAAFAAGLREWSADTGRFSLQLAYPDRKPLHAEAMNIACEASAAMAVPFDFAGAPSFGDLMQRTEAAIRENLSPLLCGGLAEANAARDLPTLVLPVAMTSLLGVRQAYALPESADPLLGMPAYEYAAQPQVALHFQVLEEERELLCNIDEIAGLFPQGLAASVFDTVLAILSRGEEAWSLPLADLVGTRTPPAGELGLRAWLGGLGHGG
ncbi:beta-ketoacyl synthase N-terminal-like domain-containing protein [Stappia indica]|uniref:KR domain-containing protein n=1 Tax=Stappia indica TaxID=538381 RepID=A0A857CDX7_9HYPH|nr:beta-ketoacyl synthase N-terminal-like domain-containing protein [Stappia indica]QGZ37045.1 KR domain-containing protein [Stappia indica]